MTQAEKTEGYEAKKFKAVPVAIEWHGDGSVTLSKEVVEQIVKTGELSLLVPPPPGMVYMLNTDYMEFSND